MSKSLLDVCEYLLFIGEFDDISSNKKGSKHLKDANCFAIHAKSRHSAEYLHIPKIQVTLGYIYIYIISFCFISSGTTLNFGRVHLHGSFGYTLTSSLLRQVRRQQKSFALKKRQALRRIEYGVLLSIYKDVQQTGIYGHIPLC